MLVAGILFVMRAMAVAMGGLHIVAVMPAAVINLASGDPSPLILGAAPHRNRRDAAQRQDGQGKCEDQRFEVDGHWDHGAAICVIMSPPTMGWSSDFFGQRIEDRGAGKLRRPSCRPRSSCPTAS